MSFLNHRLVGVLAVGLASTIWGTIGPVIKLFPEGSSFQFALLRYAIGATFLWVIIAFAKNHTRYLKADVIPILVAGIGAGAFMGFYILSFQRTGVAVASVVSIGMSPIFVGLLSWLINREIPRRPWVLGTLFGVVGVASLNWPSSQNELDISGLLFALLAALSFASQAMGLNALAKRHSALQTVAPTFTVAAIMYIPIAYKLDFQFLTDLVLVLGVIYGGLATITVAAALFAFGINKIGPANAVTVGLMEPITAATLGVALLGEQLSRVDLLGIMLVLIGLVIVGQTANSRPVGINETRLSS